jgi:cytidylate kinase
VLIAIFGGSSTGKTTLARALADRTGLDARYCGALVRAAEDRLQLSPDALPAAEHDRIDAETLDWSVNQEAGIVEGRFLDHVLSPLKKPICLVEVRAQDSVRADRWATRLGRAQDTNDIAGYEQEDEAFRVRTYGRRARLMPNFILDTSTLSVDACLERLAAWLREPKPD